MHFGWFFPLFLLAPSRVEAVEAFRRRDATFRATKKGQPVGNAAKMLHANTVYVHYIHNYCTSNVYTCISVLDFLSRIAFIYDKYMVYGCIRM